MRSLNVAGASSISAARERRSIAVTAARTGTRCAATALRRRGVLTLPMCDSKTLDVPQNRIPDDRTPTGLIVELAGGDGFPLHTHGRHQLARAHEGVLAMTTEGRNWVLPPTRALWIPAGVGHSVTAAGRTRMHTTYIDPASCPISWSEPTAVDASGLVGEIISYLSDWQLPDLARRHGQTVLWDVLAPIAVRTVAALRPVDPRSRQIADALLHDPTDERTLARWGREVGASTRTLARLFHAETGMGFSRWRTTVRLSAALPLLAAGEPVANVSRKVGYTTASAFVAAFRRELGTTPARYFSR